MEGTPIPTAPPLQFFPVPPISPRSPPTMRSLLFLCARRLVGHPRALCRVLALVPAELYPVLFRAACLDGRTPALPPLLAAWPFPLLSFRRLLGHRDWHLGDKPSKPCVQAVILAVVEQLCRALDEPCGSTRYMPGLPNSTGDDFFFPGEGMWR